ncbi:type II toxin-antitoxin system RelE/ParE family toxin [Guyparkeria hydrothermalis]|uniref:Type II toxin-antitoxin system RelE/ParE family toxin n=1 Tax=Guyparkeria halophila TaxID=47960 RepID=A0A6I6CY27_9GAMM|nr:MULTISPECIES: type II toxin-antitoxin system RelE/ParE family toxin [Guyparkeria]MCL7751334.1 type II toxin-antitoxin system RelE/ParE family toxin [Guyparkeria hydrothermalis]QGT78290.1 type II toxin-antitoxin system RelE/ParE family toxin [Guyparkeria halophila]TKA89428.1 type II toxin-antitoxin system RelE/ParE family toxin [Guyparkeria sp. SB14A]
MIVSFACKDTQRVASGRFSKRLPQQIQRRAKMRLDRIDAARDLDDLRVPPSHRLEALSGDRLGFHSVRINDQWRIVFRWEQGGAHDVAIVDYH